MRPSLLLLKIVMLAGLLAAALSTVAQTPQGVLRPYPEHHVGFRCAFDSAQQAAFQRQPGAEAQYRAFLQAAAQLSPADEARLLAQPDVTVPVVMHIIHTGGADNISDAQVYDALRIINEDYSKLNPDTVDVIPPFLPIYANVGFRFRLARLDPNGNCTTGITRTYSTDTNIGDDRVKRLIVWDQDRYLNIWITTNANGAGGYSYLPCSGGTNDGIVIRSAQFGSIGLGGGSNLAVRSLTHEIGHFFGLPHTWGGSNTPGLASNCGIDDGIADTPNTTGILGGCNLNFSPCLDVRGQPILSNVQNYMDYAGCTCMFTTDQRTVMRTALQLSCRSQLTTAANLLATGTNDGYSSGTCAPVIAFRPSATQLCEGGSIAFDDYSYNADLTAPGTTYSWVFPGGTPATSAAQRPIISYTTSGVYDVSLTITTPSGASSTLTRPQLVQVVGANTGLTAPLTESFENLTFPNNFPVSDLRNWVSSSSVTSGSARWQRLPASGSLVVSDGAACVAVRSNLIPAGTITWLTSPNIDLSSFSAANLPVLTFDRAYAIRPTPVAENLQVQFSDDCGVTWVTRATFTTGTLNTLDTTRLQGFVPTNSSQWQSLQVPIPTSALGTRFQLRFQLTSRQGNPLYLDHVALRAATPTATQQADVTAYQLRLMPNPQTAETAVYLTLNTPGNIKLTVLDMLGRALFTAPVVHLGSGAQRLPLPAMHLLPGLYLVQILIDNKALSAKLIVP